MSSKKKWLAGGGLCLGAFVGGTGLTFMGVTGPAVGFYLALLGGFVSIVGILATLFWAAKKHTDPAFTFIPLGILPAVGLIALAVKASQYPTLNDVATNLQNPPMVLVDGEPQQLEIDSNFVTPIKEAYGFIEPVVLDMGMSDARAAVEKVAGELGIVTDKWVNDTFFGHAISGLYKFRDDVSIRLEDQGGSVKIDIRSRSRLGKNDLGANAARIHTIGNGLKSQGQ